MKLSLLSVLVVVVLSAVAWQPAGSTVVNAGEKMTCPGMEITAVRVKGCNAEPCNIKKGKRVPVEIDFTFTKPDPATKIEFSASSGAWDAEDGSTLKIGQASGDCETLFPGASCPLSASDSPHTLKTSLLIPKSTKDPTGGLEGQRPTTWHFDLSGDDSNEAASCHFNVILKMVA